MASIFNTQYLLVAFGFIFFALGVLIRFGTWKKWYWRTKGSAYSYLPIGVIFLLYSYNDKAQAAMGVNFWIYYVFYAIPVIVGIWWVVRTPTFVKPVWVRWVEAYPKETYFAMEQAALDDTNWDRHITSKEDVEAWVKSIDRGGTKTKTRSGSNK